MRLKLLLVLTVIGAVFPNVFIGVDIAEHGWRPGDYIEAWWETIPNAHITTDLLYAALVFILWTSWDGPREGVRSWWVVIPATFLIGFCFACPLYLYLRERQLVDSPAPAPA
jgi:hypothetical protein